MLIEKLNIAIVSDLHCKHGKEENRTTWLISDLLPSPVNQHPVEALKYLIRKENIKASLLLCPGDITNKIDQQGFISGWKFLEEIKLELMADTLIATTGNHDVDSRLFHEPKTHNYIPKNVSKEYPINNESCKNDYWAKDFFIYEHSEFVLLNFNSTHNHINETEAMKSCITPATLEAINNGLPNKEDKRFKIAMCHHHPKKYSNLEMIYKDGDVLEYGDKLISVLEEHDFDLFIHGHKHIPKLDYCNNLPVLCAGSFASLMNIKEYNHKNTFHLLTLERIEDNGIQKKVGKIKTWEFIFSQGWKADNKNEFPCNTGFGFSIDIIELAKRCAEWFEAKHTPIIKIDELFNQVPELLYLTPSNQEKLTDLLIRTYNLEFHPSLGNYPKTIQKIL